MKVSELPTADHLVKSRRPDHLGQIRGGQVLVTFFTFILVSSQRSIVFYQMVCGKMNKFKVTAKMMIKSFLRSNDEYERSVGMVIGKATIFQWP